MLGRAEWERPWAVVSLDATSPNPWFTRQCFDLDFGSRRIPEARGIPIRRQEPYVRCLGSYRRKLR
jgi:hypothetical protein